MLLSVLLLACTRPTDTPRAQHDSPDTEEPSPDDSAIPEDSGEPVSVAGLLWISEVMSDNHGTLTDADGDSPDWIELFNPGPEPVSLGGMGITDDPGDPFRATLPDRSLAPGAFLVLYASGKAGSADPDELHLPFRIDADGEALVLSAPSGAIIDQVVVPALREDISWGRPQAVETATLVGPGSAARLDFSAPTDWLSPDLDDSDWTAVQLPVGFDTIDGSGALENLALFHATTQSSDGYGFTGAEAVDDEWSTFSHTGDGDLAPWWQVDLGQAAYLSRITLLNRTSCCAERLYNITVEILDGDGAVVWGSAVLNPVAEGSAPTTPGDTLDSSLDETVVGRFVRVSKVAVNGTRSSEWMSLAEVQVWGTLAAPYDTTIETDLTEDWPAGATQAWLRVPLPAVDLEPTRLTLDVLADDGFAAWLDGAEVARDNLAGEAAVVSLEAATPLRFDLDPLALDPDGGLLAVLLADAGGDDALLGLTLVAAEIRTEPDAEAWFDAPTPGEPNGPGIDGFVADPTASPARGFFTGPFSATLTTRTPGATLVYTLDGSRPTLLHGTVVSPADPGTPPEADVWIDTTAVVRVAAFREGWGDSHVVTHSFLFLEDVIHQPAAPAGLPTVWAGLDQAAVSGDYEMDPEVVEDPAYAEDLLAGLRAIPTLSVVMDPDDLWGEEAGIYIHSTQRGSTWERAASVELILPDGSTGFQEDCGVRIHGYGWRPHTNTKKHSLRLEFSSDYGARKLEYPLFPDAPVERFDSIVLRAQGSRSWQDFRDPEQALYVRDAFARDTARDMGKADGHAAYVHLYLNGLYWGLYMPVERPDADFGAERFGGDADEYDAINRRTSTNEAIDGTLEAYNLLLSLSDADLTDPAAYDAVAALVDIDDLIDYMLIHQYTTNRDGPEEFSHNNMRGVRRRLDGERFRFFVWDMEYSLWNATDAYNVEVDVPGSASHVYARLRTSPTFRARYAERARLHLTSGGALTPEACLARFEARITEIEDAIVGESARWGDTDRSVPYTRDVEWAQERDRLAEEYFPTRTAELIRQLQAAGLYE